MRNGNHGWTLAVAAPLTLFVGACTVGPDYTRPKVAPPDAYRSQAPRDPAKSSFGAETWSAVFKDPHLRTLISEGLTDGFDMRIAASRILQAEAQFGITRADEFPTVNAQASGQKSHGPTSGGGENKTTGVAQLGGTFAWEIDFWGKYRRATEAARAQLAASEWGRRAVATTLVSQLANGYFALLALDAQLEVSQRTLASREDSLHLAQVRERGGATSLIDVRQAEQLIASARGQIIDIKRRIEQQENALNFLVGHGLGPIDREKSLLEQEHAPVVPEGLPSELLERRADIVQAEQLLIANNAQIGVAKAAYFPSISLTGAAGVASSALSSLFSRGAWAFGASAIEPVYNAGRNRSRVRLAEERRNEASLVYQQKVQQAFREVSDAIVGYSAQRGFRETQEDLLTAARDARRLAEVRYRGGVTSYLEVIDSDSRLFVAELGLAQARLGEMNAFVELYRALGGGWKPEPAAVTSH
jgi:multidrug efflux system outer membrane protein